MRKLLAICAAVALFFGDCAWGMENEDTQNLLQQTDSTGKKSRIRGTISKGVQKLKKLNPFKRKHYEQQMTQTEDISLEQISINQQQIREKDRFVKHEDNHYNLFHYEKMQNSAADEGFSTPIEIVTSRWRS